MPTPMADCLPTQINKCRVGEENIASVRHAQDRNNNREQVSKMTSQAKPNPTPHSVTLDIQDPLPPVSCARLPSGTPQLTEGKHVKREKPGEWIHGKGCRGLSSAQGHFQKAKVSKPWTASFLIWRHL